MPLRFVSGENLRFSSSHERIAGALCVIKKSNHSMENLTINDNNFHDGIVNEITLDFQNKEIRITIEQKATYEHSEIVTTLLFKAVKWQNLRDFNQDNIIWGIEVTNSFDEFRKREDEYLNKMKNYFPVGTLESIKTNTSLSYYFINSTNGFDGFIICEKLDSLEK